jgi:lysylphosphatidylglycerol synthetase-like protein (DUF2156 family)
MPEETWGYTMDERNSKVQRSDSRPLFTIVTLVLTWTVLQTSWFNHQKDVEFYRLAAGMTACIAALWLFAASRRLSDLRIGRVWILTLVLLWAIFLIAIETGSVLERAAALLVTLAIQLPLMLSRSRRDQKRDTPTMPPPPT